MREPGALEEAKLNQLGAIVGRDGLQKLLQRYEREITAQWVALANAEPGSPALRSCAHKLAGLAGAIAAERVCQIAQSLSAGLSRGGEQTARVAIANEISLLRDAIGAMVAKLEASAR
jgi:HPt (histidine-containing phosphotransfer) domain-containing protein